ncbi:MAG: serine/threonine protein kinase [Deltaproteobacteria bacterium]|nr:serine/threonine protein kinase [Deltaproteobacteria bacterium]
MAIPLKIGDVVADAYHVERVVGVGGMAVVAVASHVSQRHRVAIKMLLPNTASSTEMAKRFEREQRTLMQLHSEHTLRIYGAGHHGKLPYMLVEYLEGSDLSELLKNQGPVPIETAVEYIVQACHAIAEAHSLGITHRDLKPGNLFLTRRTDGSPCIKVLDFGISKVSDTGEGSEEATLTKTKAVMGSPFYMSPEQMISARNVDGRTDVWALGVTLHELLTKTLPFAANTAKQVCARILGDKPTPLRQLRPMYPQGLEEVILHCLQRRPDARFANIADLATQLAEFGPEHTRFAVKAIYELVQPSEPSAQPGTPDALLASDQPDPGDTTIYLQGAPDKAERRIWPALLFGLATFAVGTGVGWVLSLPTDPTRSAAVTPASEPAGPATGQPSATPARAEQTADLTEAPTEPIDLDELPGEGPLDEDLGEDNAPPGGGTPTPPPATQQPSAAPPASTPPPAPTESGLKAPPVPSKVVF